MNRLTDRPDSKFDEMSESLRGKLRRLSVLRVAVRTLTVVVYSAAALWFCFCLCIPFSGTLANALTESAATADGGVDFGSMLIIGILVFWALQYAMVKGLLGINSAEERITSELIRRLFPDAVFSPTRSFSGSVISASRLFDASQVDESPLGFTSYGRLDFHRGGETIALSDIGVTSDRASRMMYRIPVLNYFAVIYRSVVRPIFGTRVDSSLHSFRGLFGFVLSGRQVKGAVILMPDRLEGKIGYMARNIQTLGNNHGGNLVLLEDPDFENLFAVYADDEIEARKVLTPAMMRRLTALRNEFGRDLMMSFAGDRFYFAASTPDGFLRPGRRALADKDILGRMYDELRFCRDISEKLDFRPL